MRRRTFLAMQGVGLLAATTAGAKSLAAAQARGQIQFGRIPALVLSPDELRTVISFVQPGDYRFERVLLADDVFPRGTTEVGRLRVRPWDLDAGVTMEFETSIGDDPDRPTRRAVLDAFGDVEDRFVSSTRSSYGSHMKSYLVGIDGLTLELMGHGVSGVVGRHAITRGTMERTDTGYVARRWIRDNPDEAWTLIAEATWTRTE